MLSTLIYSNTPGQTTITVAVAANFRFAMGELSQEFKKETGIDIKTVISSSGKLGLRNRLTSKIKTIEKGKILTKIVLDYKGKESFGKDVFGNTKFVMKEIMRFTAIMSIIIQSNMD